MSSVIVANILKPLVNNKTSQCTVGADKNGTLVVVHFSAQAASISISSIIQTLQVGGVLESSGLPLHDGRRDI